MLKVITASKNESGIIEYDEYIPVVARWAVTGGFPPIYWRAGDFERNLVEVGLSEDNGSICKIVVTSLSSFEKMASAPPMPAEVIFGHPQCELSNWLPGARYWDEKLDLKAFLHEKSLILMLQDNNDHSVAFRFCAGPVFFDADREKRIVRIIFQLPNENHDVRLKRIIQDSLT
jgi:hypothetical protein